MSKRHHRTGGGRHGLDRQARLADRRPQRVPTARGGYGALDVEEDPVDVRTQDGVEWTRSALVLEARKVLQNPTSGSFARASAQSYLRSVGR